MHEFNTLTDILAIAGRSHSTVSGFPPPLCLPPTSTRPQFLLKVKRTLSLSQVECFRARLFVGCFMGLRRRCTLPSNLTHQNIFSSKCNAFPKRNVSNEWNFLTYWHEECVCTHQMLLRGAGTVTAGHWQVISRRSESEKELGARRKQVSCWAGGWGQVGG